MHRSIFAVAFSILSATASLAQAPVIVVSPDQQTMIREYVVRERVRPVTVQERVQLGEQLPAEVELTAVPQNWGASMTPYRYAYANGQVVFVEPSSRRIVHIVDASNPAGSQTRTDGMKRDGQDK